MLKKFFILFAMLGAVNVLAQSMMVKGIVKDITTHRPVSHVTVATDDGRWVTITNENGAFSLACPTSSDKIKFSHLNYTAYIKATSNLPGDGIYYLEPKNFELDEVIIINTPINEFMDNLIKSSVRQLKAPIVLSTYYREFVNINGKNTKFADGLIDYNLYKKNEHKAKTGIVVKQSRAAELNLFDEPAVQGVGPSVVDAVEIAANFALLEDMVFHNKKSYKKYDYVFRNLQPEEGIARTSITFKPKEGIKEALFDVSIVYNPERNIILNIDAKLSPEHKQYTHVTNLILARYSVNDFAYKSIFKVVEGHYMPSYSYIYGILRI